MISPAEIRQHNFKRGIRGFDPDEVKAFLQTLAQEWENQLSENRSLKAELKATQESLQHFREMESMLHKTLLQAEQSSKATLENAQREAEIRLQEAEQQAQQLLHAARVESEMKKQEAEQRAVGILSQAYEDRSRIEREVHQLNMRRNEILSQLSLFLTSQLERIQSFSQHEAIHLTTRMTETKAAGPVSTPPVSTTPTPPDLQNLQKSSGPPPVDDPAKVLQPVSFAEPLLQTNGATSEILRNAPRRSFFEAMVATADRTGMLTALADELE
jgi:cell division initiation protein